MWVRAQIDYLQRLPNDTERWKSLSELPPDLPTTYIRIFNIINSQYPPSTQVYIQRALKWLVLHGAIEGNVREKMFYYYRESTKLTCTILAIAISIDPQKTLPSPEQIPSEESLISWLGCLVRVSFINGAIELAHFSLKEFLLSPVRCPDDLPHSKYLVNNHDQAYLCEVCMFYLTTIETSNGTTLLLRPGGPKGFDPKFPFYGIAASSVESSVMISGLRSPTLRHYAEIFLGYSGNPAFQLWINWSCGQLLEQQQEDDCGLLHLSIEIQWLTPLHFACYHHLVNEVKRLVSNGSEVNGFIEDLVPPLLLAFHPAFWFETRPSRDLTNYKLQGVHAVTGDWSEHHGHTSEIIRILLSAGADPNERSILGAWVDDDDLCCFRPLGLAIFYASIEVCLLLLANGATLCPESLGPSSLEANN